MTLSTSFLEDMAALSPLQKLQRIAKDRALTGNRLNASVSIYLVPDAA